MCRKNRSLTAENQALCKLMVKCVIPSATSCISTVFMNVCNICKIWLFNFFCMCRIFYAVNVMNITCCMELRHKQSITIPKFSFYQRPVEFLKTKCCKFIFDRFKELDIRICPAWYDSCRRNRNVVSTESSVFPFSCFEHFWSKFTNFVACNS